jgi:hypothetical protein
MSDQRITKFTQEVTHELPYCSGPNCGYCKQLREMQEQVSKWEADCRNNRYLP